MDMNRSYLNWGPLLALAAANTWGIYAAPKPWIMLLFAVIEAPLVMCITRNLASQESCRDNLIEQLIRDSSTYGRYTFCITPWRQPTEVNLSSKTYYLDLSQCSAYSRRLEG